MLLPIEPTTPLYALKRFGVRLGFVALFAAAQILTPWGFAKAFQMLLGFMTLICAGIAASKREFPSLRTLNHWDEAGAFLVLCIAVHLTAFHLLYR